MNFKPVKMSSLQNQHHAKISENLLRFKYRIGECIECVKFGFELTLGNPKYVKRSPNHIYIRKPSQDLKQKTKGRKRHKLNVAQTKFFLEKNPLLKKDGLIVNTIINNKKESFITAVNNDPKYSNKKLLPKKLILDISSSISNSSEKLPERKNTNGLKRSESLNINKNLTNMEKEKISKKSISCESIPLIVGSNEDHKSRIKEFQKLIKYDFQYIFKKIKKDFKNQKLSEEQTIGIDILI